MGKRRRITYITNDGFVEPGSSRVEDLPEPRRQRFIVDAEYDPKPSGIAVITCEGVAVAIERRYQLDGVVSVEEVEPS